MKVFKFYVLIMNIFWEKGGIVFKGGHYTYTVLHMFRQVLFGAKNQSNHQHFEKSLLSCKCELIFIGMKEKNFFFFEK